MPDPIAYANAARSQRTSRIVGPQLCVHDRHVVDDLSKRKFLKACRTVNRPPCGRSKIRTLVDDLVAAQNRLAATL